MRALSTLLLLTSALSLAACGGGGGGGGIKASGISSGVGSDCPISEVDSTPDCPTDEGGGGVVVVPPTDTDGDGVPDGDGTGGTDGDGNTGSGAGGNTTGLTTGNKAIVLKSNVLDNPTSADSALATLSSDTTADLAATTEAILGTNKPKKLLFKTDTKSAANSNLAVAQIQKEYVYGTRDLRWLFLGHTNATVDTIASTVLDKNGNSLAWSDDKNSFVYTANDPGGDFNAGEAIDMKDDDLWAQFIPFMNATDSRGNLMANGGAGANYREYRLRSNDPENYRDETLQVWAWNDSYATQYRNGASNGEPKQEIWSFGGRKAETVRTGGKANYSGRWVGTAKTSNWIQPDGAKINPNALWMVQGSSVFAVDFGGDTSVKGTLTAETWTSDQDSNPLWTWQTPSSVNPSTPSVEEPDYVFYDTKVKIDGKLVNDGTPTGANNQLEANASLSGGFLTGDNAVQGGLFGNNAQELTGVFHVQGGLPQPIGGSTGQTDGKEGALIINGAFNNTCTKDATGACVVTP